MKTQTQAFIASLVSGPEQDANGWQAELKLQYGIHRGKTRLIKREQRGPLTVQRTYFPEGQICHTYLLHPPGGVVGGDELTFDVTATNGGHALLTTPGATKFYRSNGKTSTQRVRLSVSEDSTLEWLPMENIFFPGANARW